MTDYSKLVPCPSYDSINTGLSAAKQSTMLKVFGRPGRLTKNCSRVTNENLRYLMVTQSVGPFRVTGLRPVVEILTDLFAEVKATKPDLYLQVKTAGMTCCRAVRGSRRTFSNHSWGTAVDLYFGDYVDYVGDGKTQLGLLQLYYYFRKRGFYWGCEFGKANSKREDSMHMECSDELIWDLFG